MKEYSEVYELKESLKELAFRKGFYRSEIKKKYYSDMNGLLNDLKIYSYSEYMPSSANRYGGQGLWQLVKDWKIDHSNENTHLHYLDFVAQLMATGISASSEDFSIVPIPPHNFSKDHPGQVSLRLAERIAGYLNAPVELELERVESADYKFKAKGKLKEFKRIILIDDQITNGNTAYQAFKALQKMDYSQIELHTFTFSGSKWLRVHGESLDTSLDIN